MTPTHKIQHDAQAWATRLSSDDIDKAQLEAFKRWHQTSRAHAEAFLTADKLWLSIGKLEHLKAYAQLPKATHQTSLYQRWYTIIRHTVRQWNTPTYASLGVACIALACFIILQPLQPAPVETTIANYATTQGEVKTLTLSDGSLVTLGAQSRIQVSYSTDIRQVILAQGDALFDVTHNPERPFIVLTGDTETRVLGTIFSIERDHAGINVAVKEGKVKVGPPNLKQLHSLTTTAPTAAVLLPGQAVTANHAGQTQAIRQVSLDSIGSWEAGRLIFDDVPLKAILADANRYSPKRIILADQSLANTRLSLSMNLDKADQFVDDLASLLPLEVKYSGDAILLQASH